MCVYVQQSEFVCVQFWCDCCYYYYDIGMGVVGDLGFLVVQYVVVVMVFGVGVDCFEIVVGVGFGYCDGVDCFVMCYCW